HTAPGPRSLDHVADRARGERIAVDEPLPGPHDPPLVQDVRDARATVVVGQGRLSPRLIATWASEGHAVAVSTDEQIWAEHPEATPPGSPHPGRQSGARRTTCHPRRPGTFRFAGDVPRGNGAESRRTRRSRPMLRVTSVLYLLAVALPAAARAG